MQPSYGGTGHSMNGWKQTGEEDTERRRGPRCTVVHLSEDSLFTCQLIDVGRVRIRISVSVHVVGAQLVGSDQEDFIRGRV